MEADGGDSTVIIEIRKSCDGTDEISPLLVESGGEPPAASTTTAPPLTIFSISYSSKKRPYKELPQKTDDIDMALLNNLICWVWSGSKYSGLLCMILSSIFYFTMEAMTDIFPVSIPLFQTIFTRCSILLILSLQWLRRSNQAIVLPSQIRNMMGFRCMTGLLSLICFVYSVSYLPKPVAVMLNFATPIMATIGARFILQEIVSFSDALGLACSCCGLLFIKQPTVIWRVNKLGAEASSDTRDFGTNLPMFPLVLGLVSSILSGVTFCLIRAGAKVTDHPGYTVFSFAAVATLVSGVFTITLQEFVMPDPFTVILMILLGILAFLAEISLARGLQLVKVGKVTNMLFTNVLLSQVLNMMSTRTASSFSQLFGCLLILGSISSTLYVGLEKDNE